MNRFVISGAAGRSLPPKKPKKRLAKAVLELYYSQSQMEDGDAAIDLGVNESLQFGENKGASACSAFVDRFCRCWSCSRPRCSRRVRARSPALYEIIPGR